MNRRREDGEGHLSRYVTSHPGQLSLAIPSWVGAMSISQREVMPCSWGVKAGMVRMWVAGKTVWSPCYTRAISERFRDKELIIKRYINSPSLLFYFFAVFRSSVFSVCPLPVNTYFALRCTWWMAFNETWHKMWVDIAGKVFKVRGQSSRSYMCTDTLML